jgi:aldehyde dehydrogenase (NAD+)
MIVPRAKLTEVEAIARATVEGIVIGDPDEDATVLGPIANRAQFQRVQLMIAAGIEEGAKLVCGGPGQPDGLDRGFFVRPTIFSDVRTGMRIAQEEIFGPVLAILSYDDVDEAIAIANDTIFGLGGHVHGADLERVRGVARRIRTGQVHLNNPAWDPHAPFGGYKRSGNGREYGAFGFEEYLEVKAILGYA